MKIYLVEMCCESVEWIKSAQDSVHGDKLLAYKTAGNFLTN
jgi:hypothetical protein